MVAVLGLTLPGCDSCRSDGCGAIFAEQRGVLKSVGGCNSPEDLFRVDRTTDEAPLNLLWSDLCFIVIEEELAGLPTLNISVSDWILNILVLFAQRSGRAVRILTYWLASRCFVVDEIGEALGASMSHSTLSSLSTFGVFCFSLAEVFSPISWFLQRERFVTRRWTGGYKKSRVQR